MAAKYLNEVGQPPNEENYKMLDENYRKITALQDNDGSYNIFKTENIDDMFNLLLDQENDKVSTTAIAFKVLTQYNIIRPELGNEDLFNALIYLESKQNVSNGSFKSENQAQCGDIVKYSKFKDAALTSFILIGVLENEFYNGIYQNLIQKGLNFIEHNYYNILHDGTNLDRALTLYLYVLAGKDYELILDRLEKERVSDSEVEFWNLNKGENSSVSAQVEISSYVALSLLKIGKAEKTLEIGKFLLSANIHEDKLNTITSSILGLQALAKILKTFNSESINIHLSLKDQMQREIFIIVNQRPVNKRLPAVTNKLYVNATGHGIAMFEITCQ